MTKLTLILTLNNLTTLNLTLTTPTEIFVCSWDCNIENLNDIQHVYYLCH